MIDIENFFRELNFESFELRSSFENGKNEILCDMVCVNKARHVQAQAIQMS